MRTFLYLFLLCLLGGLTYYFIKADDIKLNPVPIAAPVALRYENSTYGYVFNYPSSYDIQGSLPEHITVGKEGSSTSFSPEAEVEVVFPEQESKFTSFDQFANSLKNNFNISTSTPSTVFYLYDISANSQSSQYAALLIHAPTSTPDREINKDLLAKIASSLVINKIDTATSTSAPNYLETGINQGGELADLTITPLTIVEDSRCPIDVRCIQAGTVRLQASVEVNGDLQNYVFTLGKPVVINGENVRLSVVKPDRKSQSEILSQNYIFGFGLGIE